VLTEGQSIPAPDHQADFVVFFSVFTHLLHEQSYAYLSEARRVLRPGGKVIFSFFDFGLPLHWCMFAEMVNRMAQEEQQTDYLTMFIGRDAIRAWAEHLGFEIEAIQDGDAPNIRLSTEAVAEDGTVTKDFGALGQSYCVLRVPDTTEYRLKVEIERLHVLLAERKAEAAQLQAALGERTDELRVVQTQLDLVQRSAGWKALQRVRGWLGRLAPPGSRREALYRLGRRALNVWIDRGIRPVLSKTAATTRLLFRRRLDGRTTPLPVLPSAPSAHRESPGESEPARARQTACVDEGLPYMRALHQAGAAGQVLHRDDVYCYGPPNTEANEIVLALIRRYARAPVLDVGCGIGVYVAALQAQGLAARGLEINPAHVAAARQLGRPVDWYEGKDLPFAADEFDTALAIEVLEHIPDWEHTLSEMLRVARRCVLFSVPNIEIIPYLSRHQVAPWHMLESTHVNFFTPAILSKRLDQISGISYTLFTYGPFEINGEAFDNHILAVIHKQAGKGTAE
jgi:SAM-dependent methyltransferase